MGQEHDRVATALAAFAAGALEPDEAVAVEHHLAACGACRAEAERLGRAAAWLGTGQEAAPPGRLREAVLAAARRGTGDPEEPSRPDGPLPGRPGLAAEAFAAATADLDALLGRLSDEQWGLAVIHGWTVPELLLHLAAADGLLAARLGLAGAGRFGLDALEAERPPAPAAGRAMWLAQAGALLRELAARSFQPRWLPDAVLQRAFETSIHADDLRAALGRPPSPPAPDHLAAIVGLGVRMLPSAVGSLGLERPGQSVALRLHGPGGGAWDLPLSAEPGAGPPAATVTADATAFFYLMGNRRDPRTAADAVAGDQGLAVDLLRAVATLGCD